MSFFYSTITFRINSSQSFLLTKPSSFASSKKDKPIVAQVDTRQTLNNELVEYHSFFVRIDVLCIKHGLNSMMRKNEF